MRTIISFGIIVWIANNYPIDGGWACFVLLALMVAILQDLRELSK